MTIDQALQVLTKAKRSLGGGACLILSLTASGIEDADVSSMEIIRAGESRYVQVSVAHPALNGN